MKSLEFYHKHRLKYPSRVNPIFSKRNLWHLIVIIAAGVLVEPVALYKYNKSIPFTLHYYFQAIKYSLLVAVPFGAFIFWVNWRELKKKSEGYEWVGKFEVVDKKTVLTFCYLHLAPGGKNKIRVHWGLFEKIRIGDFIVIRRDVFGNLEKINKVKNLPSRLAKAEAKGTTKGTEVIKLI